VGVPSLPAGSTLTEYVEDLRAAGVRVVSGNEGTYWVASHQQFVRRLPTFHTRMPDPSEVDRALRSTGALVATYLSEPDEHHAANAWLYLSTDHDYSLMTLAPVMQRNVRRAMRELRIAPLTASELLAHGSRAFCDTRRRTGLAWETSRSFRRYFGCVDRIDRPGRRYLGAWKEGQLAAFVKILHVDDWIELGSFSMDSMLRYRPNDALLYVLLSHYLAQRHCRVVSFGVSSIQADSNVAGLHRFKRKVGFKPSGVHRAFVLHPSVRAFGSPVTLSAARWAVSAALRVRPRERRLKKLDGMLACMLGATSMMDAAERSADDDGGGRAPWQGDSLCTT
jgi:predicted nucleic acid-binding protein